MKQKNHLRALALATMSSLSLACWLPLASVASDVEHSSSNLITQVKSLSLGSRVTVGGTVEPIKSVTLTAQLPGRVLSISGEEGSAFPSNTILLELDTTELLAQRHAAEAQFASANAALRNAWVQRDRMIASPSTSQHAPGGMGMPNMFDQMFTNPMSNFMGTRDSGTERHADIFAGSTQIEQARQSLAQAQAQIAQIDTKLRDAKSVSPFDGVIIKKHVEVGDTVQPGQPLLEFADTSRLQIIADLPARLASHMKVGDKIEAKIDLNNSILVTKVTSIFPVADSARHTIRVEFGLPEGAEGAAGIYAEVRVPDPMSSNVPHVSIPISAVVQRGGLPMVFVVDENQRTALRLVRLGEILPNGEVVVLSGLTEKERVLDKPSAGMSSGQLLQ